MLQVQTHWLHLTSILHAGKLVEKAAIRKRWLYREIIEKENLFFVPFAIETLGPICEEGHKFIDKIAKKNRRHNW